MSGLRHRNTESHNGSILSNNEPEGASSTTSSDYDRYYWKNVHNPNKVLKMRHYFGGMESEANGSLDGASNDALTRTKSMPSLEKWTADREWGLAHKGQSVRELRARFEALDAQITPRQRHLTAPEPRERSMRRVRSSPGLERASPEPRIVPQRRTTASSERNFYRLERGDYHMDSPDGSGSGRERNFERSSYRSGRSGYRHQDSPDGSGSGRSASGRERSFERSSYRSERSGYRHQDSPDGSGSGRSASGRERSFERSSYRSERSGYRHQNSPDGSGLGRSASSGPERRWTAEELRFREQMERKKAAEANGEAPEWMTRATEMKARRDAKEEERVRALDAYLREPVAPLEFSSRRLARDVSPSLPSSDPPSTIVIDSVQLRSVLSSNSGTPRPSPRREPEQAEARTPIADWRYHYQVERTPISNDFDKNRERFEIASREEDEKIARRQAIKMSGMRETDLDAVTPSPRATTQVVLARQTTPQNHQPRPQKQPYDPELLNPYGNERPGIHRAVINLGKKPRGGEPPRLDDFIDSVQKYAKPPSGRPRDVADGSEMAWKSKAEDEAIYANINVIRQHQQQQKERQVHRDHYISQQKVQRHQMQYHAPQNGRRHQSERNVQHEPNRRPQPRYSSTGPSQRPLQRPQSALPNQRSAPAPTQPGWEPARCVWDSRYHTWRRYDRATNDYVITQPANRIPPQSTSPLTESLRPMLVDLDAVSSHYDARSMSSRGPTGISLPNGLTLYSQRH